MGAKILDFIMRKNVCDPPRDSIDLVSKIGWRDIDAGKLKAFFRRWESYAAESDDEALWYAGKENHTCKAYSEGYRDAILDLIDDIGVVFARMPEPVLDLDGWHK